MDDVRVFSLDSITRVDASHVGHVVIAGSHGGVYAGHCAAEGHVRAVILNDAGIGKDRAGIGSLAYLQALGIAAATADGRSCRIGEGDDMRESGVISFVNDAAAAVGCAPGQRVVDGAALLRRAPLSTRPVPAYEEARFVMRDAPGQPRVIVMDSISLVDASDAGAIVIAASHGGLLGRDPATALRVDVLAAVFSDAGFGKDRAGVSRMPVLDRRGIAGATASASSARIGDGRSLYAEGILSFVNETAGAMGIVVGDRVTDFIGKISASA